MTTSIIYLLTIKKNETPPSPCVWDTSAVVSHGCSDRHLQLSKAVTESQCWQGSGKWDGDGTGTCRQKSDAAATAPRQWLSTRVGKGQDSETGTGPCRQKSDAAAALQGSDWEPVLARGRIVRRDGNLQTEKLRSCSSPRQWLRASVGKGQDSETGWELADRKVTQLQLSKAVTESQCWQGAG